MKHFIDTEFIEWAGGIQLVSLGIIREDGATFYAESTSFDERLADDWVRENVLKKLEFWKFEQTSWYVNSVIETFASNGKETSVFGSEAFIKEQLLKWLSTEEDPNPEFYAYFADYDWVVFCRIFGRMISLPDHFPKWLIDLKQMMWERGLDKDWKRKHCPDPEGEHNALVDAKWNMKLHGLILEHGGIYYVP